MCIQSIVDNLPDLIATDETPVAVIKDDPEVLEETTVQKRFKNKTYIPDKVAEKLLERISAQRKVL